MATISQSWIWLLISIVGFFLLTRMGGCGVARSSNHDHRGREYPANGHEPDLHVVSDPVNHHTLANATGQISTVYRGRAFYFESRENRDVFEQDPEKYIGATQGQPIDTEGESHRYHRRGGC